MSQKVAKKVIGGMSRRINKVVREKMPKSKIIKEAVGDKSAGGD